MNEIRCEYKSDAEDFSFENYLMEKYPSLFNTDENGNVLPPECGISCPPGWYQLIDDLCESIVNRVKHGRVYAPVKNIPFKKVRYFVYTNLYLPITLKLDPASKLFKTFSLVQSKMCADARAAAPFRMKLIKKLRPIGSWLSSLDKYEAQEIPPVKIGQIKQKFGTLRFYYDGGDSSIHGMVSFAEHISGKTCEETGERGSLHRRGMWYRTLSDSKAKEFEYNKSK